MSRPSKLPSWVDDDDPLKSVEPSGPKKLQGWIYKERVPFQFWNWVFRHFVKWFVHLDESTNHFDPHEAATPDMTVVLSAGRIQNGVTLTSIAEQATATITAPSANPRIDRVVIDNVTGVVSIIAGSEAASPVAPAITLGKIGIAQILLQTTSTSITNSMITDERGIRYMPLIDEDDMVSDDDTVAPTQQSVKAFVETRVAESSTLLEEYEVTGSAEASIVFSGLDINTHKSYRLEIEAKDTNSGIQEAWIYFNGDTTNTNYYTVFSSFAGASNLTATHNRPKFSLHNNEYYFGATLDISRGNGGYCYAKSISHAGIGASITQFMSAISKTAPLSNITQITLALSVGSFDVGTIARLYRGDA